MNKIYLTLLALIALLGAQSASAKAYTVFQVKQDPWRWQIKTNANGWNYVGFTLDNPFYSFYFSDGFDRCNFAGDNGGNEVYVSNAEDLHLYDGSNDKGALKVKVNGTEIDFSTRNGQVYSTASQIMNGTSAQFTVGFTDGTWYKMIADGNVTVGAYVSIKRDDSINKSSFSLPNGSKYHFELNTANMQIKVVQESGSTKPETGTWYCEVGDAGKKAFTAGDNNTFTFMKSINNNTDVHIYYNDDEYAYVNSDNYTSGAYWLDGDVAATYLEKSSAKWFHVEKYNGDATGTYTFTINASGLTPTLTVTKDAKGGGEDNPTSTNWNDYVVTKEPSYGVEFVVPDAAICKPLNKIEFTSKSYSDKGALDQLLTATHSQEAGDVEYHWVKYEKHDWDGSNTVNIDPVNALYLSDTHLYHDGPRRVYFVGSDYVKKQSMEEMLDGRKHSVEKTLGLTHTPRNFTDAWYRAYAVKEVKKEAKANAKALSANARAIRAVITGSSEGTTHRSRVAYTAEVKDNTSGITGIEVDKPVIGENGQDAAPVYYNLQGVKVSRPAAGQVYIVKRGDKVTKEVIK